MDCDLAGTLCCCCANWPPDFLPNTVRCGRMLPSIPRLLNVGCIVLLAACGPSPALTDVGVASPSEPPTDRANEGEIASPVSAPPAAASSAGVAAASATTAIEAERPGIACGDASPLSHAAGAARACVVRGRLAAVRDVEVVVAGVAIRALTVEIEPGEVDGCVTPLDARDARLAEPEATFADNVTATRIELVGARRLLGELRVGRALCGWAKRARHPGLPAGPVGWEGSLVGDGSLLLASSTYLDPKSSRMLARGWRFGREGTAAVRSLDEGGAFVEHPFVRVTREGRSVRIADGEETLTLPDGARFAVRARSRLTVGKTPVFTGRWDGFEFSALRVP